jgi:hypothetical protein
MRIDGYEVHPRPSVWAKPTNGLCTPSTILASVLPVEPTRTAASLTPGAIGVSSAAGPQCMARKSY